MYSKWLPIKKPQCMCLCVPCCRVICLSCTLLTGRQCVLFFSSQLVCVPLKLLYYLFIVYCLYDMNYVGCVENNIASLYIDTQPTLFIFATGNVSLACFSHILHYTRFCFRSRQRNLSSLFSRLFVDSSQNKNIIFLLHKIFAQHSWCKLPCYFLSVETRTF